MLHVDESVQMESRPGRFYHFISTCVLIVDRRRCSACFQLYQRLLASLDPLLIDRWGGELQFGPVGGKMAVDVQQFEHRLKLNGAGGTAPYWCCTERPDLWN